MTADPHPALRRVRTRERRAMVELSRPSAVRLFAYLNGDPVYQGKPVTIYAGADGNRASYTPFDDGLLRHDIHVVLHSRNALAGYVPPSPEPK